MLPDRAIVTVRLDREADARDLEVPLTPPADQLATAIANALGWPADGYLVWAEPPGRLLRPDESLAQAGAWEGARLTLQTGTATMHPTKPDPDQPGYLWKRLDRD
jgi:hypothetical protein